METRDRGARRVRSYRPRVVREAGVRPSKALGQHFLSDYGVLNRILAAADLGRDDVVIEVGPGLGVLTGQLAQAAGRVIAVELDAKLAARLRQTFEASGNAKQATSNAESDPAAKGAGRREFRETGDVTVLEGDVLASTPAQLLGAAGLGAETPYVVVANLPYNIGAAVLRHFLESERPPRWLVVMLQREVAQAIVAQPGALGLLGVSVQVYAQARRLFNVPARAFYPPPKVTSSVIRLDVRPEPLVAMAERERFFTVVRAGFSAPRKQLRNSLANGLQRPAAEIAEALDVAGLDGSRRPQELGIEEWLRLSRSVSIAV
jgi:16S rRNA (adenine1518-N6/adenine1519-N6)-dimethyltransferase